MSKLRVELLGGLVAVLGLASLAWLLWAVAGMTGLSWGQEPTDADLGVLGAALGGLLLGGFVHVPAHELGHLVAALVLRLPVVGFRVGPFRVGLARQIPGSSGHVLVRVDQIRRALPARMVVLCAAGVVANLGVVLGALAIAGDAAHSLEVRGVATGVMIGGVMTAIFNAVPVLLGADSPNDGLQLVRWLARPGAELARVKLDVDLARLRAQAGPITGRAPGGQLRAAAEDPRPEVATVAMTDLLTRRPRGDDGWQDADLVARFAVRRDVDGSVRAALVGNYALALTLAHLGAGEQADRVPRLAELADLALAADRQSVQARTAQALVLVVQGRPDRARTLLVDVPPGTSDVLRVRALAVRGLAEVDLGELDQAARLAEVARRLRPDDRVLRVLALRLDQNENVF